MQALLDRSSFDVFAVGRLMGFDLLLDLGISVGGFLLSTRNFPLCTSMGPVLAVLCLLLRHPLEEVS